MRPFGWHEEVRKGDTNGYAEHRLLYYRNDNSNCLCCSCKENETPDLEAPNWLDCINGNYWGISFNIPANSWMMLG